MATQSRWVPLKRAADELGVSYSTALKWVKAKVLRTKRTPVGKGKHMVLRSDMETLYR